MTSTVNSGRSQSVAESSSEYQPVSSHSQSRAQEKRYHLEEADSIGSLNTETSPCHELTQIPIQAVLDAIDRIGNGPVIML